MMGRGGRHGGQHQQQHKYRNPCLTMHQPWASLLIHGIKRIEGRSWPAPIRGRLWIHAAAKVPDQETINAMEEFYREIYAVDGVTDLKFPEHYPVSRLLGCVDVVGCLKREELVSWDEISEGVRLEGQTEFCWLCEQPQKLVVPFEMRGFQGIYNLEKKVFEGAARGLSQVQSLFPVRFPLPDPSDLFSLKPGSLVSRTCGSQTSTIRSTRNLSAAIAGVQAAATQFSKKAKGGVKDLPRISPLDRGNEQDFVEAIMSINDSDILVPQKFSEPRTRSKTEFSGMDQTGPGNAGNQMDNAILVQQENYSHTRRTRSKIDFSGMDQTGPGNAGNQIDNAIIVQHEKYSHTRRTRSKTDFSGPVNQTRSGIRGNEKLASQVGPHSGESSYKIFAAALRGLKS